MKSIYNISQLLKKILVIVLLVVSLAACGEGNEIVVGQNCSAGDDGTTSGCVDAKDAFCLGCKIFSTIYDAVGENIMRMHRDLTQGSTALLMVGFSIWLAIRILKFVSSVNETNIGEVWNEIIRQAFTCFICGYLASSPTMLVYTINTFIYPIYISLIKLGLAILERSIENADGGVQTFTVFGSDVSIAGVNMKCSLKSTGIITSSGFPKELRDTIVCVIQMLQGYLSLGGEIATAVMSQSEKFMATIGGLALFLTFWVVKIGFVFYLVDTIFQMGLMILLFPIFIMSYAFKPTRKWANIGFVNILSSSGFLMCFSIIVALVLRATVELIDKNPNVFNPSNPQAAMENISVGFLCLLLIGFLVYGSMEVTQKITGSLIGGQTGGEFMKRMKAVAQQAWGLLKKSVSGSISFGISVAPNAVTDFAKKLNDKRMAVIEKMQKLAGRR